MKAEKTVLIDKMPGLYAVGTAKLDGEDWYLWQPESFAARRILRKTGPAAEHWRCIPLTGKR